MPNWNSVLEEIKKCPRVDSYDFIRRKYLKKLYKKTKRNILCYYSGFLQKPGETLAGIHDGDKNGLMTTVHKLDKSKGLDILLHTPGGSLTATESFVNYLYKMFNCDIRVIVPQIAMSAGTLIACASKEIIMGKQSNIGPIDPQLNGIPAYGVIEEFNNALREIKEEPGKIPLWQTIISKYHPTFIGACEKAIELAGKLLDQWLKQNMFKDDPNKEEKVSKICSWLNNHSDSLTHSRHFHIEECIKNGLNIVALEEDDELQDLVLTVHHSYMQALANTSALKIIENHMGHAMVNNGK